MSYKRNQSGEAIARIVAPDSAEPPSKLRTRIKRLLELDRSIRPRRRSKEAEEANFAFFSGKAPGTGADISFSEYEAFERGSPARIALAVPCAGGGCASEALGAQVNGLAEMAGGSSLLFGNSIATRLLGRIEPILPNPAAAGATAHGQGQQDDPGDCK
jgi:hypothetical protein